MLFSLATNSCGLFSEELLLVLSFFPELLYKKLLDLRKFLYSNTIGASFRGRTNAARRHLSLTWRLVSLYISRWFILLFFRKVQFEKDLYVLCFLKFVVSWYLVRNHTLQHVIDRHSILRAHLILQWSDQLFYGILFKRWSRGFRRHSHLRVARLLCNCGSPWNVANHRR